MRIIGTGCNTDLNTIAAKLEKYASALEETGRTIRREIEAEEDDHCNAVIEASYDDLANVTAAASMARDAAGAIREALT